jgi:UDP-glucose 4-epimerase
LFDLFHVADILAVAGEVTGRAIPVVRNPPPNEPQALISDRSTIRAGLGWPPARSALREIVADAWGAVSRT